MIKLGDKVKIKDIYYDDNIKLKYGWGKMAFHKGEKGTVKKLTSSTSVYVDFPSHPGVWHGHPEELTVVNKYHQTIDENYNI